MSAEMLDDVDVPDIRADTDSPVICVPAAAPVAGDLPPTVMPPPS